MNKNKPAQTRTSDPNFMNKQIMNRFQQAIKEKNNGEYDGQDQNIGAALSFLKTRS
jgi:hypothetical protein